LELRRKTPHLKSIFVEDLMATTSTKMTASLLPPQSMCGVINLESVGIWMAKLRGIVASISLLFLIGRALEIVPKYPVVENTMEQVSPQWIWPWIFCVNEILTSSVQGYAIRTKQRALLVFSGLAWNATLATTCFCMWMLMFTLTIHVATYDKWRLFAFLLMVDIFIMLRIAMSLYELCVYRALYYKWKYENVRPDAENGSTSSDESMKRNGLKNRF